MYAAAVVAVKMRHRRLRNNFQSIKGTKLGYYYVKGTTMEQNITAMDGKAESCRRWRSCRVQPDTY